ncbi:MAG: hypothetical protein EOP20_03065 [Hyphomicrobiales bacterium]|nr:MAG: hypothetical protein EOP20_03065 [Hyphomicrobiales bacterium]
MSRWNPNEGTILRATVGDYFQAAEGIITPYATTGLEQVVSVLAVASDGTARVAWSCGYNGGTQLPANQEYPLDEKMKDLATNKRDRAGFLVASTTSYSYKPLLGMVFPNALNLQSEALFLPRFGATLAAPTGGCPTP